jgi:flagellar protein FliS
VGDVTAAHERTTEHEVDVAGGDRAGMAASRYQQQDIQTADPLTLVVRVYELGCLHAARTRAALAESDPAAKGRAVHQLSRCLSHLQGSLDMERGGDVARNLDRLYTYLHAKLNEGHLNDDDGAFEEVARHLNELRSAWVEALQRQSTGRTPPGAGAAR